MGQHFNLPFQTPYPQGTYASIFMIGRTFKNLQNTLKHDPESIHPPQHQYRKHPYDFVSYNIIEQQEDVRALIDLLVSFEKSDCLHYVRNISSILSQMDEVYQDNHTNKLIELIEQESDEIVNMEECFRSSFKTHGYGLY
jgi:hypothetical protein